MYTVLKVQESVQGYVSLTLSEDGEQKSYTARISVYNELGMPSRGDIIGEGAIETLRAADEYYRGKRAALSILSYGDNNAKTLCQKLRMRSISEDVAQTIVREMISLGYIDESRQLERLILEDTNRKLLGPRKVVPRLLSKGYSLADIKEAYEALSRSGEIDVEKNKETVIEKFLGDTAEPEELRRLLFKYGYDF